jgi:hypothetical protein
MIALIESAGISKAIALQANKLNDMDLVAAKITAN